jgi:Transposase IS66 family
MATLALHDIPLERRVWETVERLKLYLQNGRIEIDQNLCENAMRALAVENWLHIGSQEAGPKIAAILSVMETRKRLQINLRKYLNDVLPKLPSWWNAGTAWRANYET